MKTLILLLLLPVFLTAQNTTRFFLNSISCEILYLKENQKEIYLERWSNKMLILNYERTILKNKLIRLSGVGGLGISGEQLGEYTDFVAKVNINAAVKCNIGIRKHWLFSGLLVNNNPFYSRTSIYLPFGYKFNFGSRFSAYLSYSQLLLREIKKEYKWIWDANSNRFLLSLGLNFHF